ncbi:MAG: T9SS type A sorting domain-containing protein [Thermoanaerobaculia bacterium]|nr:T9SS type A sorting domain-containing protein [Thermoanaerobaculia bacterium]
MKTRLFTLLVLFALGNINYAQAQWQVIYPPLPDSLNFIGWGISVVDENIVWGSPKINIANTVYPPTSLTNKYYYKTLDGGKTWSWGEIDGVTVENDAGEYWFNAHLCGVDSNSAWVVRFEAFGNDTCEIFRTTDGGDTWVRKTPPFEFTTSLLGIHFFNQKEGVVWGEEHYNASVPYPDGYPGGWRIICFVTGDGGDTWEKALLPDTEDEGIMLAASSGIFDVIGDHIWFPTTKRVFHSGDRGKTWNASTPLWTNRPVMLVAYRDTLCGLAFSDRDLGFNVVPEQFKRTEDGGNTWATIDVGDWPNIRIDLEYVPGSGGVYWATSPTHTALSTDNGETWSFQTVPEIFWFAEFLSPKVGWGAGAKHPTPSTSQLVMYKWIGDSLLCQPCDTLSAAQEIPGAGVSVQVAPNPVTDRLFVRINAGQSESYTLRLTDINGKTLLETAVSGGIETPVEVSGLPAGVYWVRVMNGKGEAVAKVVKG